MTRSEEYGGQRWGIAPPLNETAPEGWEPRIVKMTRLEEIEKWIDSDGEDQRNITRIDNLLYALDCYKARVAVLEQAGRMAHDALLYSSHPAAIELPLALALTPEECLEKQKGVG